MRAALIAALLLPACAWAQYAGPAVEACRAFAEKEHKAQSASSRVVFDRDRHLGIDRYDGRVGSQKVASLLYGNGAIVLASGPAVEMSFTCLLADEKRPVFFHWTPRSDASALTQCTRSGNSAGGCLEALLQVTEQDLTQAYAARFQEARDADSKAGNENASDAIRRSNQAWLSYRDAECARHASADARKACIVDLSRRRLLDVR